MNKVNNFIYIFLGFIKSVLNNVFVVCYIKGVFFNVIKLLRYSMVIFI